MQSTFRPEVQRRRQFSFDVIKYHINNSNHTQKNSQSRIKTRTFVEQRERMSGKPPELRSKFCASTHLIENHVINII
jgi:hypothetical protein